MRTSQKLLFRLDVHQDLRDFFHFVSHLVSDRVGDHVPLAHSQIAAHNDMQIHVVAEAHLAHKALFHSKYVRNPPGYTAYPLFNLRCGRRIQQLRNGPAKLLPG